MSSGGAQVLCVHGGDSTQKRLAADEPPCRFRTASFKYRPSSPDHLRMLTTFYILIAAASAQVKLAGVDSIGPSPMVDFCKQSGAGEATGKQAIGGGRICSSTPQGLIPDVKKMVSTFITSPPSGSTVNAAQGFQVKFQTINFNNGFAVDGLNQYLMAPQTLDPQNGFIQGSLQLVAQHLPSRDQAPSANSMDFFAIVVEPSDGKKDFTIDITPNSLKQKGTYRICIMAGAASFQPVVMPVAQRGSQDDCIRVKVE